MANQTDIEAHYDTVGTLHALRLRDVHDGFPDYSCAFFDGDFRKTLKQAQEDKHTWIFDGLGLGQDLTGKRLLDIGCGWGPILQAVRKRDGESIGLTLSPGQVGYCVQHELDARLLNYKDVKKGQLGKFDGIIAIGALEHFCSVQEHLAGKQEGVYRRFFEICADMLAPGARLYLQTTTWGKKVPDYHKLSLNAGRASEEAVLARMEKLYPGSWLPAGLAQLTKTAEPYFTFLKSNNGRLDYLETLRRWRESTRNLLKLLLLPETLKAALPLLVKSVTDRDARIQLLSIYYGDQDSCYQREIMSHERIFFEKQF